jgi:hypothetical protein
LKPRRAGDNRALLWVRLDLATLLRRRDAEEDRAEASIIFSHIVKNVSGEYEPGFPDKPDLLKFLAVAEKALQLMRSRKQVEALRELT